MAKKKNSDELMMNVEFNKKLATRTQKNIDNLYKTTWYTDNKDKQYIDNIRDQMNKSLNGLIDRAKIRNGDSNISELYSRTLAQGDKSLSVMKEITDSAMLSDILDLYSNNTIIRDMDREIDVVLKYVPRLNQGLKLIKQAVLASDHMDKESTKIEVINAIKDPNQANDSTSTETSEDKLKACKKKYEWKKFEEELYEKTAKYGEQYVYILPYKKALERVMKNKESHSGIVSESSYLTEAEIQDYIQDSTQTMHLACILESNDPTLPQSNVIDLDTIDSKTHTIIETSNKLQVDLLDIEINASGCIPSIVSQASNIRRIFAETVLPIQEVSVKTD